MRKNEELKKMDRTSNDIAKLLRDYSDKDAIVMLLCGVIGIAMKAGISQNEVFGLFSALCDEAIIDEATSNDIH